MDRDWIAWHRQYEDPSARLRERLAAVRAAIAAALDAAPPGRIRVVSACAGDGRDLLGVLEHHPRSPEVVGRLVELDPVLAAAARRAAPAGIEVVEGDASLTDTYVGAVPADLVLLCGVFGNISDEDVERTIGVAAALAAGDGRVIWTRHRRPPDLTPTIRSWFAGHGFSEVSFQTGEGDATWSVGVHRHVTPAPPLPLGERMFAFDVTVMPPLR